VRERERERERELKSSLKERLGIHGHRTHAKGSEKPTIGETNNASG
jgi:hypothetical protein